VLYSRHGSKLMRQELLTRLRASSIALLLLLNWVVLPVSSAFYAEEACAMVCCVEDGFCCCTPPRPSVRKSHSDDHDLINSSQLAAPCPPDCGATHSSGGSFLRAAARTAGPYIWHSGEVTATPSPVTCAHEEVRSGPSSPRAPPFFSI
jgi:hypothetical protein